MQWTIRLVLILFLCAACSAVVASGNSAAGKEKSQTCVSCHGEDGNGTAPNFPRLAGQYEGYILQALLDYKSGKRKNPVMAGIVAPLEKQDMKDLAAYYAAKPGLFSIDIGIVEKK